MDISAYRPAESDSERPPPAACQAFDAFERAIKRIDTRYTASISQLEIPAPSHSRSPAIVGTMAMAAGVRSGDIILGVSGQRIENVQALRRAIKDAKGSIALLVQRGPAQAFIPVPLKRP